MAEVEPFDQFVVSVARESWQIFRRDPALFVIAGLVMMVVSICTLGLLTGPLSVGFIDLARRVRAGETVAVSTLFGRMDTLVSSSVALFVFGVLFVIGLMLVVPWLLVLLFFGFSLPAIAYERIGGIDSLRRSAALVRGNVVPTLALMIALSLLHALGNITMLGWLITAPLGTIALAVGYERLANAPALAAGDPYARS
jgi:hypothetical protein